MHDFGLAEEYRPAFYLSVRQLPFTVTELRLAIRTSGEPTALVPAVRATVRGVDKNAPLFRVGTMKGWVVQSMARSRFAVVSLLVFAGIALLLSAMGLYGVTASYVALHRRTIGIRMALGAVPRQAFGWVLARAAAMAGGGLVVGLAASLVLARVIEGMLFQVEPGEPVVFLAVSLVLVLVVLAGSALPARRAATVDPAEALRCE